MIKRPLYLQKLVAWKDKQPVKIISGVRRSGKSTLFKMYQDYLLSNGVTAGQIINLNMEDPAYNDLLEWKKLYDRIHGRLLPDKKNYVFLDEIQNVPDFQRAADGLCIKENVDLYLTGSNSRFQSGEWATMLAGRYVEIHILPLSFKEYVSAYPYNDTRETMYRHYLENSSFPYAMMLTSNKTGWDKSQIHDYLSGIYSTIVLKDVVENKKIKELDRLERMIQFMADNIGSPTSANNIANTMTSNGTKIDYHTIEKYLRAFCDSYILYRADRYDIKDKKILKTLNKYYLVDIGLRYFLLGSRQVDTGHILENIVYLELLRRAGKVYVGKIDLPGKIKEEPAAKEIDFVAEGGHGREYYQVAETVLDKKTLNRELAPLDAVSDHNPKFLLTMDSLPRNSYNGIQQINVLDWLLGEA